MFDCWSYRWEWPSSARMWFSMMLFEIVVFAPHNVRSNIAPDYNRFYKQFSMQLDGRKRTVRIFSVYVYATN